MSLETTTVSDLETAEEWAHGEAGGGPDFDVTALPGGTKSAIEAVLMVVDEPVTDMSLASALELPVEDVREHLHVDSDGRRRRRHGH